MKPSSDGAHVTASRSSSISEAKRIAQFMDLPRASSIDDMGLVDRVRKGFPARTARVVVKRIDPEGQFVRETDLIPKSTLHRRKDRPLTKDESEKILSLSRVFLETLRIYHEDADRAARFLKQPHPMLTGRSPIDLATESTVGADLVLKLLLQADAGVAA